MRYSNRRRLACQKVALVTWTLCCLALLSALPAQAAPQAHILRIDPRASMEDGAPILTTVVELVQNKRMATITSKCAYATGTSNMDCMANALVKKEALYTPLAFPEKNALFTVHVNNRDVLTTFVSRTRWGKSKNQEGVGTAWLLLVDAAAGMGRGFAEAKHVARRFINTMGRNDIVDVMFFNDRTIVSDSKWLDKKSKAIKFLNSVPRPFPAQGRTRQLFNIIKQGATDGFSELGNVGSNITVPMHQAMVVLSNGASGTDTGSPAQSALLLRKYMTKGRFPEDNKTLPKAPVPIISVWFPKRQTEELYQNARQFMENMANTEIGGFYSIIRGGQSGSRAVQIVNAVRRRFDQMHIVKWRVPCISPTITQTFRLVFKNTKPAIAGDNFENVPVGIDPSTWPLDIDMAHTKKYAKKHKVHPGGKVKIFGNFCWGSDHKRAQLYMIPKNQPAPTSLKGKSVKDVQEIQKKLISSNMVGKATNASDAFVEFEVPSSSKFLTGKGKKMTARLVIVDSRAYRTSAVTADKILTLPAEKKPLNLILIGGLTFGGVVLLLLVVQIFRGGGGGRGRRGGGGGGAPRPVVAPGMGPGPGPMGPGPGGPGGPPGPYGPR